MNILMIIAMTATLQVQGPVVGNAAFVEWDYPAGGTETGFNIRCGSAPGVDHSAPPIATTPAGTLSWPIQGLSGQQHCDVTAVDFNAGIESLPSNEVAFFVFPPPTGARVRVSALTENLDQLERLGLDDDGSSFEGLHEMQGLFVLGGV